MTTVEDLGGPWHPGSGEVAEKTNLTIAALLQQDFERFAVSTLRKAVQYTADVHSEQTVGEYCERVIEHGPFERVSPGTWEVLDEK